MAKGNKKKKSRRSSDAIPLAIVMPLAVPVIRAAQQSGSYGAKADRFVRSVTGVSIDSGKFNYEDALPFWMAAGAGLIVHKVASSKKVNYNRYVKKATMGFFNL